MDPRIYILLIVIFECTQPGSGTTAWSESFPGCAGFGKIWSEDDSTKSGLHLDLSSHTSKYKLIILWSDFGYQICPITQYVLILISSDEDNKLEIGSSHESRTILVFFSLIFPGKVGEKRSEPFSRIQVLNLNFSIFPNVKDLALIKKGIFIRRNYKVGHGKIANDSKQEL